MFETSDARKAGREAIQKSVAAGLWKKNLAFRAELLGAIQAHEVMCHPVIAELDAGRLDLSAQRRFHLEFGHAFACIFTDALIEAMFTSRQLESRLGVIGKISGRFLLQLNVLDELGFVPGGVSTPDYAGNPHLSHYAQFDATLRQLGISAAQADAYVPSAIAEACRATFEQNYDDHAALTGVLAVAETVFTRVAGPWAKCVGANTGIDVSTGYHSIHVEKDGHFVDDDHSEDAWFVFQQALTLERHADISAKVTRWLDTWSAFFDQFLDRPATARVAEHSLGK
jgi:hypothetical protein